MNRNFILARPCNSSTKLTYFLNVKFKKIKKIKKNYLSKNQKPNGKTNYRKKKKKERSRSGDEPGCNETNNLNLHVVPRLNRSS